MSDIIPNLTMDSIPNINQPTVQPNTQPTAQINPQIAPQSIPQGTAQSNPMGSNAVHNSPILGTDGQPLQPYSTTPVQQPVQPVQTVAQNAAQTSVNTPAVQSEPSTTDFNKDNPLGVEISTGTKAAINLFERSTGNSIQSIMDLAYQAIEQGNISLMNKTAMQLQFGENAPQAEAVVQAIIDDTKQARQNIANHCYAKVGGEQQWGNLVNAFKGTADKGTVEAVKTLFDSGHIDVAISMMQQHVGSTTKVTQGNPNNMLQGGTGVQQGITATQLQQALVQLKQRYPNQSWETGAPAEEYNKLLHMRKLGAQAGI